ncbi:MAG: alpha/beta fold hydrolase [Tepidisphaeraceae bacterium]|jgi:pimeloyl-ACP methyl ester carboxylesterase
MPNQLVHGATIHYRQRGAGVPLVLVHGFPLDQRLWEGQWTDLSRCCRVITPDLPGFGLSGGGESFSIESLADDLHAFLQQMEALPAVLGGLSMGGYVAQAYVQKYAADLRGLILLDTRASADTPAGKQARNEMIELARQKGSAAVAEQMRPKVLPPQADPQVLARVTEMMTACPSRTIQQASAAMRDRPDYTEALGRIAVPTLVVVGELDALSPPSVALAMQKAIPRATLAVIAGAGHLSPIERPQQVNRAIEQFLAGISPPP